MDARAFASPKRLRPHRRVKPAHDEELCLVRPRLCSAPLREGLRAALRPEQEGLPLHLERQPGMVDQPPDQAIAHRSTRRPDAGRHLRRVAQQANRAFGYYLRSGAIARITIALDGDADLTAVRRDADEHQIIKAALALFLRRALARLRAAGAGPLRLAGGKQASCLGFAL